MTPAQQQVTRLLQHYGQTHHTSLNLQDGVCVMNGPDGQEAAVLEVPGNSDALLLHCQLVSFKHYDNVGIYHLMLLLNFEMAAMKGCWLALDENDTLRLCTQQTLDALTEPSFNALLSAFISQAVETRLFINNLLSQVEAA
ncbi:Tir chaperone family protein CesT|uniref:Tir chaperone family protein CesT n=1 Tax=Brenneria salicis ATCC 15712 = DSM 30166 TaxID=714314 RepID=A0A366IAY6_9GAMM|nr:type III secretion system chaperone [Brenneria salicis]NMN91763.1 Tir chaperone family protein CesT [Brenneria salicis ATCC 15712 = DSM 30166]RBP65829.1 Tir chaperone family protein CesT [Brenneria salicis ATCC 15712 = DSM 30166]RLM31864.1 DspFAvrF family protein [Brenneria salicis ATCC 15712 = DSM 30166]